MIYAAWLVVRWDFNKGRSAKKSVVEAGRVWRGVRVSLEMAAMMPRWEGEDTRSLKAECSSWETVIPDCITVILWWNYERATLLMAACQYASFMQGTNHLHEQTTEAYKRR